MNSEHIKQYSLILFFCLFVVSYDAVAVEPAAKPKIGRFKITFPERSPHSLQEAYKKRCKDDYEFRNETDDNYNIADESFEVHVPASYDPEKPAGLFVWCPAGDGGGPQGGWTAVCDKYNMLYVGANNAGNKRTPGWFRIGFALDAVHNMQKMYHIDKNRIYIGGISGGGSRAVIGGLSYPDIFSGIFSVAAPFSVTPYIVNGKKNSCWDCFKPPKKTWEECKVRQRIVYLAGDKDNLAGPENIEAVAKTAYSDFKYKTGFLLVPGLGHAMPDAEWFDKAVVIMDTPLEEVRKLPPVELLDKPVGSKLSLPKKKKILEVREDREMREWISSTGAKITASIIQEEGSYVVLKKEDGAKIKISKYKLSKQDQDHIETLKSE